MKPVSLTVTKEKFYLVDSEPVAFANLETELRKKFNGEKDPTIILRIDKSLDVQSLVEVMDLGMRMQVKMVLQTSME